MARAQRAFKATMLVTGVIIFSKVFGFVRDMILANYFGTGMANDAYVSAYSLFYLPVLLFNSCISATLIPLYVQEREQRSLKHANHFASNTLNLFALAALVIAVVTFFICVGGIFLGKKFGTKLAGKASILGGAILIFIGLEIFIKSWF